jgi:hypothetical protein
MTIPFSSAGRPSDSSGGELRWSRSERAIARKAFDHTLNRELQEVIRQAKQMAAEVKEPYELWELEQYLTQRRKEVDRKYEYRSSKLRYVFGTLLHEGLLTDPESADEINRRLRWHRKHRARHFTCIAPEDGRASSPELTRSAPPAFKHTINIVANCVSSIHAAKSPH